MSKASVGIVAVSTEDCGLLGVAAALWEGCGLRFDGAASEDLERVVAWISTYFGPGHLVPKVQPGLDELFGRRVVQKGAFPSGSSWQMACVAALGEFFFTNPAGTEGAAVQKFLSSLQPQTFRANGPTLPSWRPSVLLVPIGKVSPDPLDRQFKNAFLPGKLPPLKAWLDDGPQVDRVIIVLPNEHGWQDVENFDWGDGPRPEIWLAEDAPQLVNCVVRAWRIALGRPEAGPQFSELIHDRSGERNTILKELADPTPAVKPDPPPKHAPAPPPPVGQIHGSPPPSHPRADAGVGRHLDGAGRDRAGRVPRDRVVGALVIAAALAGAAFAERVDRAPSTVSTPTDATPPVPAPGATTGSKPGPRSGPVPRGPSQKREDPPMTREEAIRLEALRLSKG